MSNNSIENTSSDTDLDNRNNNYPTFPTSEKEAEEMLLMSFDRDPEKIRNAAKESYEKMIKLAEQVELKNKEKESEVVNNVIVTSPGAIFSSTETVELPKEEIEIKEEPKREIKVRQHMVNPPPGYLETPEGLYTWSPDIWGGRPLHGVPDRVIEREGRATLIVFIIVAPAYGRNRNGRVVSLPEGARLIVHAGVAWAPMIPLAKGPEGRPVIWAAPTTVDDMSGKIRIAEPGDKLHVYETGDGGKEYGLSILYDPDPKDSTKPRLITLETLRGVG